MAQLFVYIEDSSLLNKLLLIFLKALRDIALAYYKINVVYPAEVTHTRLADLSRIEDKNLLLRL